MKTRLFAALSVAGSLLLAATVAQAQELEGAFLLDTQGGVELWSVPLESPAEGVLAAELHLRSQPGTKLVTFENVAIRGDAHQVWDSVLMGPTAKGAPAETALYNPDWSPFDSHLLITPEMVGGEAGRGYNGISEENNGATTDVLGLPDAAAATAVSGLGDISMVNSTDAFFLDTPFQLDDLHFAYVVSPAGESGLGGAVTLTVGVLGEGIVNSGEVGGAFFDAVPVQFAIPEPASGLMALLSVLGLSILRRRNG